MTQTLWEAGAESNANFWDSCSCNGCNSGTHDHKGCYSRTKLKVYNSPWSNQTMVLCQDCAMQIVAPQIEGTTRKKNSCLNVIIFLVLIPSLGLITHYWA